MTRPTSRHRIAGARAQTALVASLACLLAAGCMLRLVYPRLDTLAAWQLDREFRLHREQERWLSARLEERLAWHRRQELPRWRDWLQAVRDDVAAGSLTAERHAGHRERLGSLLRESAGGFLDVLVTLLAGLDDEQVAHFLARYDEETGELREALAETSTEERTEKRREEALERAEDWLGRLTPPQRERLSGWSREAIDWGAHALESRRRWRAFLWETLAARSDAARLRRNVERMLGRPESLRSPAYQREIERYESHVEALHLGLLRTATDEQRRHLVEEIDDWLDDLASLCAVSG